MRRRAITQRLPEEAEAILDDRIGESEDFEDAFLKRIRKEFSLPVYYQCFDMELKTLV